MSGRNLVPEISRICSLTSHLNYFNKTRTVASKLRGTAIFFRFASLPLIYQAPEADGGGVTGDIVRCILLEMLEIISVFKFFLYLCFIKNFNEVRADCKSGFPVCFELRLPLQKDKLKTPQLRV